MKISTQAAVGAAVTQAIAFAPAVVTADPSVYNAASIENCPMEFQTRLAMLEAETSMYKNQLSSGDDCQAEISHVAARMDKISTTLETQDAVVQSNFKEMTAIRHEVAMKDEEIAKLRATLEQEVTARMAAETRAQLLTQRVGHLRDSKTSTEQLFMKKLDDERRNRLSRQKQAEVLIAQLEKYRPSSLSVDQPRKVPQNVLQSRPKSYRFSPGEHVEYSVLEGDFDAVHPAIVMEASDMGPDFNPSYRLQDMATSQCFEAIFESEIARYLPHEQGMDVMCKSCSQCSNSWWPCRVLEFVPVPNHGVAFGSYNVQNLKSGGETVRVSSMWTKWVGNMEAYIGVYPEFETLSEEVVNNHDIFNHGDHVEYRQDSLDDDAISLRSATVTGGPFRKSSDVQDNQEGEETTTYQLATLDDNTVHNDVPAERLSLLVPHAVGDIIHCTDPSVYAARKEHPTLLVGDFFPCQVEAYDPHPLERLVAYGTYDVRNLLNGRRSKVMVRTTRDILDMTEEGGGAPMFVSQFDVAGAPTSAITPILIPTAERRERLLADSNCVEEDACINDSTTVLSSPIKS